MRSKIADAACYTWLTCVIVPVGVGYVECLGVLTKWRAVGTAHFKGGEFLRGTEAKALFPKIKIGISAPNSKDIS